MYRTNTSLKSALLYFLSALPALLWITWYHAVPGRERYFGGDSASYAQSALAVYARIKNADLPDALGTVFTLRNNRQTAAHLPLTAGLILTDGLTQRAGALTNGALLFIFLLYLQFWLRRAKR